MVHALNGNVGGRSIPAEFIEAFYPVRVEWDCLPVDSGGAGLHRGGLGCERMVRIDTPSILHVIDDRMQTQPWGIAGGKAGGGTRYVLDPGTDGEELIDRKVDASPIAAGTRILCITPGGGGWGDPFERDPATVAEDVALGLVSAAAARDAYGVVLDGGGAVDAAATSALRESKARDPDAPLFDRGPRFKALLAAGDLDLTIQD